MSIENTESTANHETAVVVTLWSRVGDLNSLWHTIPPSVQSMYLVEQLTDGVWETKLTRFDKIELIRTGVRRSEAYIYRRDETLVRVLTSAGIEAKQIVTVNGVQPLTGKLRVSVEHEKSWLRYNAATGAPPPHAAAARRATAPCAIPADAELRRVLINSRKQSLVKVKELMPGLPAGQWRF